MKKLNICFWAIIAMVLCQACQLRKERIQEAGVSRELAQERKTLFKDLRYDLCFEIPEQKDQNVYGNETINFILEEVQDVVLDFRENPANVLAVTVNGKKIEAVADQEHIFMPAKEFRKGENKVEIAFISGNQSLNRNDDYLYTLLVPDRARTLFPCFDQPDLKARFTLELLLPADWVGISSTPALEDTIIEGRKKVVFAETTPLSTYLFSFVAGRFDILQETRDGRTIRMYHRETDPAKLAQADTIFGMVYASLAWLEEYTGIPYPFAKYDLVILPGYQFGGMEHPGAIQFNDKRMFLGDHPTLEERLGRMELIAHETTHMWFGDDVTMAWFDDVWTKEVFANYFAAQITEPQFPQVNHRLRALRSFQMAAYSEDRTMGTNAIQQPLENLNAAGLVYGQIIYNKAPVVMGMLVDMMGKQDFQEGVREYLRTYAYGNATWDDLIRTLDRHTSEDLKEWSRVWVKEKGMPRITVTLTDGQAYFRQHDPWGRAVVWPQKVVYGMVRNGRLETLEVHIKDSVIKVELPVGANMLLPNIDGQGYGQFLLDETTARFCLQHWFTYQDPVTRLSLAITLNENRLLGGIETSAFISSVVQALQREKEPLIASALIAYLKDTALQGNPEDKQKAEQCLLQIAEATSFPVARLEAFRALVELFVQPESVDKLYRIWKTQKPFPGLAIGEGDYMKLACELAIRMPEKYTEFVETQADRISNPDRLREFRFIIRAVAPDTVGCDSLFRSMLQPENRRVEPWVIQVMRYLNHPLRQEEAVKYITPSLEELLEVQRTGDIFFPKNWIDACLRGHHSAAAAAAVNGFLERYPDYPPLLKNKILQSSDRLLRH